jgi:hypothetical protein
VSAGGRGGAAGSLATIDEHGKSVQFRIGEVLTPLPAPAHRWVTYPQMMPEEVLLLKVFDSRADGRCRFCCHTAFHDPLGEEGAHRESIEVRCLIALPPTSPHASL